LFRRWYGNEEGPKIFLQIIRACRTHHVSVPQKAIAHSKLNSEDKKTAYSLYDIIKGLHSTRGEVDAAFSELSKMSEPLERSMAFLMRCNLNLCDMVGDSENCVCRPLNKALICPAYSNIETYRLQAANPNVDYSAAMADGGTNDNPAEGVC
jgi:hypothetical protein